MPVCLMSLENNFKGIVIAAPPLNRMVLLARAFVKDPELLILDEPLHGLDMYNRRLVKDVIEAFCQRKDKTLIMVTHYKEELPACIDHSLYLVRNR